MYVYMSVGSRERAVWTLRFDSSAYRLQVKSRDQIRSSGSEYRYCSPKDESLCGVGSEESARGGIGETTSIGKTSEAIISKGTERNCG